MMINVRGGENHVTNLHQRDEQRRRIDAAGNRGDDRSADGVLREKAADGVDDHGDSVLRRERTAAKPPKNRSPRLRAVGKSGVAMGASPLQRAKESFLSPAKAGSQIGRDPLSHA